MVISEIIQLTKKLLWLEKWQSVILYYYKDFETKYLVKLFVLLLKMIQTIYGITVNADIVSISQFIIWNTGKMVLGYFRSNAKIPQGFNCSTDKTALHEYNC